MNIPEELYIVINIAMIAIVVLSLYSSYKEGFLYGLLSLLFTAICIAAGWFASPVLADVFPLVRLEGEYVALGIEPIINTLIYFILIFIILKILGFFIMPLFKSLSKVPVIGTLNKALGLLIGLFNAAVIIMLLGMILGTPVIKNGAEVREGTFFKYTSQYSDLAINYIVDHIDLDKMYHDITEIDVDSARDSFKDWLTSQGLFKQ